MKRILLKIYNGAIVQGALDVIRYCVLKLSADKKIAQLGRNRYMFMLIPRWKMYKQGDQLLIRRDGIDYILDRSEYTQWRTFAFVKDNSPEFISKFLKKDDVFFDVGANIGVFTLKVAKHLEGLKGNYNIYSFEPHPVTYSRLMNNINLNMNISKRIIPNNIGVGSFNSTMTMTYDETHMGAASLATSAISEKKKIMVKIETLDFFAEKKGLRSVDFIKIDVEGFELEVLKGAKNLLGVFKPTLFLEVNNYALEGKKEVKAEIFSLLDLAGYEIFVPDDDLGLIKFRDFKERESIKLFDILCVHHSRKDSFKTTIKLP